MRLSRFPQLHEFLDRARTPGCRATGKSNALVHERCNRHTPTIALVAKTQRVVDAHISQEDLIEFRFARHLIKRTYFDSGRMHVEYEIAESLVLRNIRIRAGEKHPVIRSVRKRCPHLLTVDNPLIAITNSSARDTRHIRSVCRFREQLTPHVFTSEDLAKVLLLQFLAAIGENGGCAHTDADRVDAQIFVCHPI